PAPWRNLAEFCFGFIGGLYGGVAGTWGPPSILFLLSIRVDKTEMVRVMSVIFAIGAVVLAVAHLRSGVLNAQTAQFSAAMLVPAGLGMLAGYKVHDRLDPGRFRFWTLVFLALMGLNLLRRGLLG
ncbi:sulfite exporter TauE/SafE family protein, partial [Pararhodobacter sp.]